MGFPSVIPSSAAEHLWQPSPNPISSRSHRCSPLSPFFVLVALSQQTPPANPRATPNRKQAS